LWDKICESLLENHRGKFLGSCAGLLVALSIIRIGFWWTVFIVLCCYVGYHIGRRVDDQKENLVEIIERYLPPGDR